MSHFEFILTGNLTPDVEERSKQLLNDNNKYYIPYVSMRILVMIKKIEQLSFIHILISVIFY